MKDYLEVILCCLAVYIFIVIAIRLMGKKELSQLSVIDLVFVLLISNSVQNAMMGNNGSSNSLSAGLVAAATLFAINFILKQIFYRNQKIADIVQGTSVMLVHEGNVLQNNMEHERISMEELETAAREHGVGSIKEIDLAVLETDGSISILSGGYTNKTRKRRPSRSMVKSNN